MFGLIRRAEHDDAVLALECELQYQKQRNRALTERVRLGEEYRAKMEMELASTKGKNRDLVRMVDDMERELRQKDHDLRAARLMCGSLEAHLNAKCEREEATA
jgi:hypothetical protein